MAEGKFNETVASLFKGMDSFLSTKTVVGEAVKFDDGTMILPLVDVSFGVGSFNYTVPSDAVIGSSLVVVGSFNETRVWR